MHLVRWMRIALVVALVALTAGVGFYAYRYSTSPVTLTVAAGTGYTVGVPASATGTLLNDDVPTATISVSPANVACLRPCATMHSDGW